MGIASTCAAANAASGVYRIERCADPGSRSDDR
jgi:hypothetical protein